MYIQKDIDRFWSHVDIKSEDECWNWLACKNKDGYGVFRLHKGKNMFLSHRFSFIIFNNKEIPKTILVCHSCDNPSCVNPNHLWLGTDVDNIKDKLKKGRTLSGENNPRAKLTWKDVEKIRIEYYILEHTTKFIAKEYNIAEKTLRRIVKGETWKKQGYSSQRRKPKKVSETCL